MRTIGTLDSDLLIEAVVVGLMVLVVGLIVHYLVKKAKPNLVPTECQDWNKNHVMEVCLFLTGAFTHLLAEFSGVNQWYVKKYTSVASIV